ncbi:hypothetical protein DXG01_000103 [Tephrocybe rancida]|nr:hypothetical protein DXG01_000103 [Tephrocybe rancida]
MSIIAAALTPHPRRLRVLVLQTSLGGLRPRELTHILARPRKTRFRLKNGMWIFGGGTSDDARIYQRERDPKIRRRPNHYFETRSMDLEDDDAHVDSRSLSRIRSSAFWELHRSVAENGEGLVRRMRDYEHSRSRTDVYTKAKEAQKRGRKHSSVAAFSRRLKPLHIDFDIDPEDEDDDEVQIFAGEMPRISLPGSACPSKRSLSLDFEGMEPSDHAYTTSQRCSSPIATSDSSLSIYHSDDEQSRHSSGTTSPNNSLYPLSPLFNLSLPEDNYSNHEALSLPVLSTSPSIPTSSPPCNITSASRTEKAIAALSLAMASGAGGIADYDALLDMQTWPSLDGCQVGEMWH